MPLWLQECSQQYIDIVDSPCQTLRWQQTKEGWSPEHGAELPLPLDKTGEPRTASARQVASLSAHCRLFYVSKKQLGLLSVSLSVSVWFQQHVNLRITSSHSKVSLSLWTPPPISPSPDASLLKCTRADSCPPTFIPIECPRCTLTHELEWEARLH